MLKEFGNILFYQLCQIFSAGKFQYYGSFKRAKLPTENVYLIDEVSPTGVKSSGIKAIALKNDYVVSANMFNENDEYLTVITEKNTGKRVKLSEFERLSRARKGVLLIRDVKTNPYYILTTFIVNNRTSLALKVSGNFKLVKVTELPILDRYSTGSSISKGSINDVFIDYGLTDSNSFQLIVEDNQDEEVETIDISLDEIDEQILTIDDFLDDFNIN